MSDEQVVFDALGHGRANARSEAEIASRTGLSVRRVQTAIETLRSAVGIYTGNEGVAIAASLPELAESNARLLARIVTQRRTWLAQRRVERSIRRALIDERSAREVA